MSLRLLRTIHLDPYTGMIGLMIHANTTQRFQRLVKEYPLENGVCPYHRTRHPKGQCFRVREVRRRTVTMCDSGVFNRDGAKLSYDDLFDTYRRSGVDYGIIIDTLRNANSTIRSAKRAMDTYKGRGYRFKLVGVAQGKTVGDYLRCYDALRAMGYRYIAIGGLLNRRKNTARYVYVRGGRLFRILESLREKHPRDWMFAMR